MTVLKRIRKIINASVNDLLDKVEDPEKMVNQIIRDMDLAILSMRRETSSAIATRKMLEKKLDKTEKELEHWETNARMAVKDGNDELALEALKKKDAVGDKILSLRGQLADAAELSESLKDGLIQAEDKVQEFRRKRDTLITKKRAAETRRQLMDTAERGGQSFSGINASANQIINGFDSFERFEEKIERQSSEAEAELELRSELDGNDVERQFKSINESRKLTAELKKLKKEMGKM